MTAEEMQDRIVTWLRRASEEQDDLMEYLLCERLADAIASGQHLKGE